MSHFLSVHYPINNLRKVKLLCLLLSSLFQVYATHSLTTLVEIYNVAMELVASIFRVDEALKTQGNVSFVGKFMPDYLVSHTRRGYS